MSVAPAASRLSLLFPMLLSVALVAYGNLVALSPAVEGDPRLVANVAVAALVLALALAWGLRPDALGLDLRRAPRSALWGIGIALALGIPAAAVILLAPLVTGSPVRHESIEGYTTAKFALDVTLRFALQTALTEELAFRGVLYAAWLRAAGWRAALGGSSLVFALWHVTTVWGTTRTSGLVDHPVLFVAGDLLSLAGVLAVGLLLAELRRRTDSIAGPVVVHWGLVGIARVALWVAR
jgi:uncharacterized protein